MCVCTPVYRVVILLFSLLSCVWLFCDPMDCSPPGSSVHGIFQARILEWIAILFSRGSSWPGIKPESPASPVSPVYFCYRSSFGLDVERGPSWASLSLVGVHFKDALPDAGPHKPFGTIVTPSQLHQGPPRLLWGGHDCPLQDFQGLALAVGAAPSAGFALSSSSL